MDDRENNYGKVNLRLTPSDSLDITLIKNILEYDDSAGSLGNRFQTDREVASDLDGENTSSNDLTSLKVHGDITSNIAIDSVTTHRKFHGEQIQDNDFTSNPLLEMHLFFDNIYTKSSQELRLSGTSDNLPLRHGTTVCATHRSTRARIDIRYRPYQHYRLLSCLSC